MKVVIINKSDSTGGAAVVSRRLMYALRDLGVDARMLVTEKRHDSPFVHLAASPSAIKRPFLAERLKIFLANGLNRANLFKVDTASDGLPLHRHPLVRKADVICLNWVNQGMLSLKGVRELLRLGKPVIWTMHDMWNFTGICHHAGTCTRWQTTCGLCPLLGKGASTQDISFSVWNNKNTVYHPPTTSAPRLHFVAVSNWLANLARRSPLLATASLSVIPNAFPIPAAPTAAAAPIETAPTASSPKSDYLSKRGASAPLPQAPTPESGYLSERRASAPLPKFRILMGAARLDDPVKGLPILVEATKVLKERYPDQAARMELVTFGNIKDPAAIEGIAIAHRHLGLISGEGNIRAVYADADAVISTSLYETLPGTLVEGQVYGCIPVSFGRGGQSDIIDHLSTGYIADWDDDLHRAAANIADGIIWASRHPAAEIRARMLASARARFSAPTVATAYLRLFHSLLNK